MRKRIVLMAIGLTMVSLLTGCKSDDYKKANSLYEEGKYEEAITMYEELGNYKDSEAQLTASRFLKACTLQNNEKYDEAIAIYDEIGDYEASQANREKCCLAKASQLIADKNYADALTALDGYTDTEEGKHLSDICNVHINGMDGLITYMKENLELNDNGEYAKAVYTGKENKVHVIIYCDKDGDVLMAETNAKDADSGDPLLDLNLSGKKKGYYFLRTSSLKQVNAAYAYYNEVLIINNGYYVGYVVNASGTIDLAKYKKGKEVKIDDLSGTISSSDTSDDEFKEVAEEFLPSYVSMSLEGLQQFINEQDLRISLEDLGIKKYKVQFAEDPYSIEATSEDYSADTTIAGEVVDITGADLSGSDNTDNSTETSNADNTTEANDSKSTSTKDASGFTTEGNIDVSIKGGKAVYNSSELAPNGFLGDENAGKKALIVNFDYTNLEDEEKQFQSDFYVRAYQNGVELSSDGSYYPDLAPTTNDFYKSVLKDGTVTAGVYFILEDESPVTVILR